jgi:hypothetical protein
VTLWPRGTRVGPHHLPSRAPAGRRRLLDTPSLPPPSDLTVTAGGTDLARALARVAAALARFDQALGATHPLRQAFLHRACLDAVRRQAAAAP